MSKALIMRESCSAPLCSEGTFQTQLRGERPGPVGDVFRAITLAQDGSMDVRKRGTLRDEGLKLGCIHDNIVSEDAEGIVFVTMRARPFFNQALSVSGCGSPGALGQACMQYVH